jgi:hypothetical protein
MSIFLSLPKMAKDTALPTKKHEHHGSIAIGA